MYTLQQELQRTSFVAACSRAKMKACCEIVPGSLGGERPSPDLFFVAVRAAALQQPEMRQRGYLVSGMMEFLAIKALLAQRLCQACLADVVFTDVSKKSIWATKTYQGLTSPSLMSRLTAGCSSLLLSATLQQPLRPKSTGDNVFGYPTDLG